MIGSANAMPSLIATVQTLAPNVQDGVIVSGIFWLHG